MTTRTRLLGTTATLAAGGAIVLGVTAAPAGTAPKITAKGVGDVKLGAAHSDLRAAGLVGKLTGGCPLEGEGVRAAKLKAPLKGSVDYGASSPPVVRSFVVSGGAKARGVGVGDTVGTIKDAFPQAKVRNIPEFQIKRVKIPKGGGGRMDFVVSMSTNRVTQIMVPRLRICD